ncbi:dihydrolipoyl dehydrogenase [Halobacteriovorax marinus]|uniref:dihydrolipoyl dehydrogenase n=1 Tax=Halobacteriovorax marinus TaxID=97084 RepID=UPI003A91F144
MKKYDVIILGAGSAGLTAYGKLRHHFKDIALINDGPYGTTCARVGCMPSKLLIQVAEDYHRSNELVKKQMLSKPGIISGKDVMSYVRAWRDKFVERTNMPLKYLGENNISGRATFLNKNTVKVGEKEYSADHIIVAVGSSPIIPDAWQRLSQNVISSDQIFELEELPKSLVVIGLGPIGLELGQAFARLGCEVNGFDLAKSIAGVTDPDVLKDSISQLSKEFSISLGSAVEVTTKNNQLEVSNKEKKVSTDYVLVSIGRRSNALDIGLENLDTVKDEKGLPLINSQTLNIPDTNIYIIGDANNFRPVLHEAADEGRMVADSIINNKVLSFKRKTPMGICFTSPNIAYVGKRYSELNISDVIIGEDRFQMGRNKVIGESGVIKVYASKQGNILGAEVIGPKAENLVHYLSLAIEHNLSIKDLLESPFYHPTVEESLRGALRNTAKQISSNLTSEVCCLTDTKLKTIT